MSNGYLVARHGDIVYVRVLGLANLTNAPTLDLFLRTELTAGMRTACINLGACHGMDSTFMGILVAYHRELTSLRAAGRLVVVNPSRSNAKLLDMLGVSTVLPVVGESVEPELTYVKLDAGSTIAPLQRAEIMKKAHQHLIKLSESNREKFSLFLEKLEQDLERLRALPPRQDDSGDED